MSSRCNHLLHSRSADVSSTHDVLAFEGTSLPDWGGGSSAFLECQQTYQHGVAALQASQVWMLRETATLLRAVGGNATQAAKMEADAATLLAELMPQLQMPTSGNNSNKLVSLKGGDDVSDDGGWWWMLYPATPDPVAAARRRNGSDGGTDTTNPSSPPQGRSEKSKKVEGRFIHDFLYVGQAIADDLNEAERDAMTRFFQRELRTPQFVRAMSQRDPSANTTGARRADHNQWGSWDGWAGGSITALAWLKRPDAALDLARALGDNLNEGPFGQAHRVFGAGEGPSGQMTKPALKDQSWMAVCSGYIADGVIRGLFGFAPSLALGAGDGDARVGEDGVPRLQDPTMNRGFVGTLSHVRYRGQLFTITSDALGVTAVREPSY